jgi:hypothetical protein
MNPDPQTTDPNHGTNAPTHTSTTSSSISACLEEVETERALSGRGNVCNPIDKYTPSPMPMIHDSSPTAIFEHIDIELVREWEARQGGKLIAVPFDTEARDPAAHESLRNKILTAIVEILNAHKASVAALRPVKDSRRGS